MQSNYGTASNDLCYPVLPILSNADKAAVKKNHGERGSKTSMGHNPLMVNTLQVDARDSSTGRNTN